VLALMWSSAGRAGGGGGLVVSVRSGVRDLEYRMRVASELYCYTQSKPLCAREGLLRIA
jgi:hypothetical protein